MSLPGYDAWLEAPYTDVPDACEARPAPRSMASFT